MDDLFDRYRPKNIIDLNIVPVLDMLIAVIFFLLLSTSFVGYTKLQIPPAAVSTITSPIAPEPLSPKFMVSGSAANPRLILVWKGENPGRDIQKVEIPAVDEKAEALQKKAFEMMNAFKAKYPNERTVQMGLDSHLPYQYLIAAMDASRELLPDIVLIDYREVQALAQHY